MRKIRVWGAIAATLLLASILFVGQGSGGAVQAADSKAGVQLLIDGRVAATFQEVSGLGMEMTMEEAICRTDGKDNDCDDTDTEAWTGEVLMGLWQVSAAADELERGAWASSRAPHDIAMNAIRNLKAMVVQVEGTLQDPAATLKTKHDTVKNAIGNIRGIVRVLSTTASGEEGIDPAQVKAMQAASDKLQGLAKEYRRTYRPGRPVFGNITLRGPVGSLTDASLLDWFKAGAERKSGSIIYLDRDGKETVRYNLFEAWPVRFTSSHLVEEIEFAVERVERAR